MVEVGAIRNRVSLPHDQAVGELTIIAVLAFKSKRALP